MRGVQIALLAAVAAALVPASVGAQYRRGLPPIAYSDGRGEHGSYDRGVRDRRGGYERGYRDGGYGRRYRGNGYRCDRGTSGTIIGAIAGGLLGNSVAGRADRTTGALVGAGVGALAGRAIDRDC